MGRSFGSRTLLTICGALVILLAALAVVQYRWSTRVAAADAQREKEHLDSSAALFANEFNSVAEQAAQFLQNDARSAIESGARLTGIPKLIREIYYIDASAQAPPQTRQLTPEGLFVSAPLPQSIANARCAPLALDDPLRLLAPIFDVTTREAHGPSGDHVLKTFRQRSDRCFVALIDETYLRNSLFPQLIRQSFGATAANDYDFTVFTRDRRDRVLYGSRINADLRKPFFSMLRTQMVLSKSALGGLPRSSDTAIYVQQRESTIVTNGPPPPADLFSSGLWELDVSHKGVPLAVAFEQTRRRDLLLSLGVELLMAAAIIFLVIATRRMQRLADQKMQFVAGVSHELRTPVSAIAMLSRNQADGLVTGAERVKQYGELIHQESRRLNEMVEQTLEYAGIHSGLRRPSKNEVDLRRLIQEAVDARRAELSNGGFEVEMDLAPDLPIVSGDAPLLRTAFDNLLSNAQKHADGGHWIGVSAGYSAPQKEVLISVADRGPGIDAVDQAEIFEPFCRGRTAVEAQIPGSGLGLSLVRSAAEVHRGSVTFVSQPGRGSTFTLHLPV